MRVVILSMLAGTVLSILLAFGAAAQQSEIEGTISSQLEAFKGDDFEKAFTFATPTLQQLFQSPQNFERMVTQGYPMVWRFSEFRYLELAERDGAMFQKVQITDAEGVTHILLYRMQQTQAGWRIGGVQILKSVGATV